MDLKSILESLIFASDKPITLKQLKAITGNTAAEKLRAALDDIQVEFRDSGIQLAEVGGGYQFRTHPDNAHWVKKLLAGRPPRLTQAMLETLAIVAYRQPVTRPEIEDIRGVDCGGVLRLLLERSLIRIMGKKEEVGRPILYGTTKQFLEFFNLKDLKELPTLKEFTELSEEHAERLDEVYEAEEDPAALDVVSGPTDATLAPAAAPGAPTSPAAGADPVVEAIMTEAAGDDVTEGAARFEHLQEAAAGEGTFEGEIVDAATDDGAPASVADGEETRTWARRAPLIVEQEEDGSLDALDSALERVDSILRQHRQAEQARLEATVGPLLASDKSPEPAVTAEGEELAVIADEAPAEVAARPTVDAAAATPSMTAPVAVVDKPSRDDGQEGAPVL
jgi:segregation and condensation protein B